MNYRQLALSIELKREATFDTFFWSKDNALLHHQLQNVLRGDDNRLVYLWGPSGIGKSHLLQACVHHFTYEKGAMYLPLSSLKKWGPDVFEGIETQSLICMDDIDAIAGDKVFEERFFHLYNRIKDDTETILIFSGQSSPRASPICLPDLKSRISGALVLQLQPLLEDEKNAFLRFYAQQRGLELPVAVADFLISRCDRGLVELQAMIDRLDEMSWSLQRKLTIPFVRQCWSNEPKK